MVDIVAFPIPSEPGALEDLTGDSDEVTEGSTNLFLTTAERTKIGYLTVTSSADIDAIALLSAAYGTISETVRSSTLSLTSGDFGKLIRHTSGTANVDSDMTGTAGKTIWVCNDTGADMTIGGTGTLNGASAVLSDNQTVVLRFESTGTMRIL